ncbi:acetylornithine transaminase [Bacillus methanolicus]|uniref:Acetylornithine aminotransferase n=1 Tax=Bacillus methanolicus (strain MGA3 / ATCC 53907) TaxID=796606 RepID=I3E7N2_BACMM|nr:acetylornithine transaminase [Bacillus methanolicus]AIE59327.1 Acetylornithine aminotransferase [Bacillus methanolicus MGA3]EIJ82503.1 acetylornithine aminotransferase [Bacillus methanolicus MGA3]
MSYLFPTYQKWEIEPVSANGCKLIDANGKEYLDFSSGIGVCNLGHRPKAVEEAIETQLKKYWHVSNLFHIKEQEKAAKLLAKNAEMDLVFFANSGAEANEGAIKLARKYTGKHKIVTFEQSFHGRTFATMAATGQEKIKQGFGPMLESFVYVPFNNTEMLKNAMDESVAAVMLEIVQGEGGIHIANEEFLKETEKLCKEYGALLIIDEIQTGIGRTGKPFAFQHFGLKPDIVTVAKGLGSGLPIGAVIGKIELESAFGPGSHGSTFGGNPVSVAAAIATMETIFQEEFLKNTVEKGKYLIGKLKTVLGKSPIVSEIRGMGLMIGIELKTDVQRLLSELRKNGLIALPAGSNVLRLLPPLTVTVEEIDEAAVIIEATIQQFMNKTVKA